jgi:hypothetical protein
VSTHFEREDFWEAAGLRADCECDDDIAIDDVRECERDDDADDDAREDGGLGERMVPRFMARSACVWIFPWEGT